MIAFAGVPGCGKTTTALELAKLLDAKVMVEPEEDQWPKLIQHREISGYFSALTWFRSARISNYFDADQLRRKDKLAIIDSYYDVLASCYLGKKPFDWLINKDDPYFNIALDMAKLDWSLLPKADILIFLHLDQNIWELFMKKRNRKFDASANLLEIVGMQEEIEMACKYAEMEHNSKLVYCRPENDSPAETAIRLVESLKQYL